MYLIIILLFSLFASIFTLQKESLKYCEEFFLIGSRMFVGGLIITLYAIKKYENQNIFKNIITLTLLAIYNIYLTNILEIYSIKHMYSSKVCLIYSISPFITPIITYYTLKERLNNKKILGILIGLSGLIPIINNKNYYEITNYKIITITELSIILAVICNIYGWILLKKLINKKQNPITSNGISMIIGGIITILHSYIFNDKWINTPIYQFDKFFIYNLIVCFISNIICYNIFGYLLKYFTVNFMIFAGLMTPFFSLVWGNIFLNEPISLYFFISILLFLIGLLIFYQEEKKN